MTLLHSAPISALAPHPLSTEPLPPGGIVKSLRAAFRAALVALFVLSAVGAPLAATQGGDAADVKSAADDAAARAKKDQKKKDFAAQEQTLQKLSTPGRALVDNPIDKNTKASAPVVRSGDKKKDFAAREAEYQKASTPGRALLDNPIDKKPRPATPAERAQAVN